MRGPLLLQQQAPPLLLAGLLPEVGVESPGLVHAWGEPEFQQCMGDALLLHLHMGKLAGADQLQRLGGGLDVDKRGVDLLVEELEEGLDDEEEEGFLNERAAEPEDERLPDARARLRLDELD
ncbi:hypothetical protein Emag_004764 [Eimeria magna]